MNGAQCRISQSEEPGDMGDLVTDGNNDCGAGAVKVSGSSRELN